MIGNNIMSPKSFVIDVKERNLLVKSCGVTIPIDTRQKGQFLSRKLLASQEIMISPHSKAMVLLVPPHLSDNRDFLFHSAIQTNLILFIQIIDN